MHTFDVFDTAMVRSWWRPKDVFLAVGVDLQKYNLWKGNASEWVSLRVDAELCVRKRSRHEEVTLDEIYEEVANRTGWKANVADQAMRIELAEEERCLNAVGAARHFLIEDKAALITDTYFSRKIIGSQLAKAFGVNCKEFDNRIFCSSEYRKSKHIGTLFGVVLKELGLSSGEVKHHGDNPHSDIKMAKRSGISAVLWTCTAPTQAEKTLRGDEKKSNLLRSALAGAARSSRLGGADETEQQKAVRHLAADYAAPLIFSFCAWLLIKAKQKGLKTVYFFSRDGQILTRVARLISEAFSLGIETRYLYASRQAYYFPAIEDLHNDEFVRRWLFTNVSEKSANQLLARLNVSPDDLMRIDPDFGQRIKDFDAPLKNPEGFLVDLVSSDALVRHIEGKAVEARMVLLDYLYQEGVLGKSEKVGVVDVGWHGRLQACLQGVIDRASTQSKTSLHGFYIGLRDLPKTDDPTRYQAFADAYSLIDCLIEVFTMADHGSVSSFARDANGKVTPNFQAGESVQALQWGLLTQQSVIEEYAASVCSSLAGRIPLDEDTVAQVKAAVLPVVIELCERPDPALVHTLDALSFADDQTHCSFFRLSEPLESLNIFRALLHRRYQGPGSLWVQGSISLSIASSFIRNRVLDLYFVRQSAKYVMRQIVRRFR